jgi:glycosyltransferase involved in cell wall biosynthesis
VFRKADAITATSNNLGNIIKEYAPRKEIHVIPFGIDTELFSPLPKKTGQPFTIGMTKSLKPIYGIDYLIKALPQLIAKIPDLRVLLIGEGEQKQHLKELAKELSVENIVHFEGSVPHKSIPRYLSMMDIFVMPSLSESFGVSALEAQAMKVPVVATNIGGIPEVVKDGISGLLVKPKDSKELASAIIKLLGNDALRKYMGENGRKFVIEKYEWERNAEEMEELYESLARKAW